MEESATGGSGRTWRGVRGDFQTIPVCETKGINLGVNVERRRTVLSSSP